MSHSGTGFSGNTSGANTDGASAGGQKGTNRDAWNNPITEPPAAGDNKTVKTGDNGGNNDGINTDTIDDIWKDIKRTDQTQTGGNGNQGGNNGGQQQQQQQVSPADQLKTYLASNGLGEFTLTDAEKAELAEGKFEGFNTRVLGLVQQAHIKAISSASALIDTKIADALKKGETSTKSILAGKENLAALHTALPYTKDPAIGPVAQTVMQRFLDRGANTEQAVEGVKKFFAHTSQKVSGNEVNSNRNGNFRSSPQNDDSGVGNWLSILSPKS